MFTINNIKKFGGVAAIGAALLFTSGCALQTSVQGSAISSSTKDALFFLGYDSPEVIRDQSKVATIITTYEMQLDGVKVFWENMRVANLRILYSEKAFVDVLPGTHTVRLVFHSSSSSAARPGSLGWQTRQVTTTRTTTTTPTFAFDFKAGRVYSAGFGEWGQIVTMQEVTSPEVLEKVARTREAAVFSDKRR